MDTIAEHDLPYWTARLRAGHRRVTLRGDASVTGSIRRVTTSNVWVRWKGEEKAQPIHPSAIRVAGVYDGLSDCDHWNQD